MPITGSLSRARRCVTDHMRSRANTQTVLSRSARKCSCLSKPRISWVGNDPLSAATEALSNEALKGNLLDLITDVLHS